MWLPVSEMSAHRYLALLTQQNTMLGVLGVLGRKHYSFQEERKKKASLYTFPSRTHFLGCRDSSG